MRASEMLDLDRTMTPADQWAAEDSGNPVTNFKIPDTAEISVEMLSVDAHGTVAMRRLWCHLAKLLAACERRAAATCTPDKVMGTYHFTGCHYGQHVSGCKVKKAEADIIATLAGVHATHATQVKNNGTPELRDSPAPGATAHPPDLTEKSELKSPRPSLPSLRSSAS